MTAYPEEPVTGGEADLRLGMLGFGLRASLARYAHRPGEGHRVTVVADPAEGARRLAAERVGDVALVDSLDALLEEHAGELDGVLVLTPDHLHAEHAVRLLEAGLPVFVEKPLAVTTQDADRVLATAERTGVPLYVGHNMRHMPLVQLMREQILRGAIGEVTAIWCRHFVSAGGDYYFKDWHADRRNTTGLLLQKGAHDIDVLHWLAGGYTRTVTAMGDLGVYGRVTSHRDNSDRRMPEWYSTDAWPPLAQTDLHPVVDVEDLSMVLMRLDNGVHASYQQCHYTPDYWRNYCVIGTEGRMENFGDGPGATVRIWDRRTDRHTPEGDVELVVPEAEGGHGGADPRLVAEFVDHVRHRGSTLTSPVAAREAVAAAVAATTSLRSGSVPVQVEPYAGS